MPNGALILCQRQRPSRTGVAATGANRLCCRRHHAACSEKTRGCRTRWYEIDINGLIILGLGKLGLVHDIFAAGKRQRSAGEHAEAA
jgi:hypothetical protein